MHDDSKAAGERNPGFFEAAPLCDLQRLGLAREGLPRARQDRVRCFAEQLPDSTVTLLGDPAGSIEFAGLVSVWDEAEVGACGL